jgi:hypothetical protein
LHEQRDEHFGNGRLVRNIFEDAIRRLANRVADVTPITTELLTRLHPADIHPLGVPAEVWHRLREYRYRVECPGCRQPRAVPGTCLGRRVKCNCGHDFVAQWGEVVTGDTS